MKSRTRLSALLVFGAVTAFLAFTALAARGGSADSGGWIRAAFIDVGQGDSTWLHASDGTDVLIDGGPAQAGPTVVAYLQRRGIDDVDVLVVSHAHADHAGGLVDVLRSSIPVEAVVVNGPVPADTTSLGLAEQLRLRGLTPTPVCAGDSFQRGPLGITVLNPQPTPVADQNEDSVVLLIDTVAGRVLLTGDIGVASEQAILGLGKDLKAGILKVAHHGSKYSSGVSFLAAVQPATAVISVGINSFGSPSGDAINRLRAAGARVLRTDEAGTVLIGLPNIPQAGYQLYLPYAHGVEGAAHPS